MRSFSQLWPTLKRLLAYGSPWRKPLGIAVLMMWVAAAAEVSGPLLISYFIDNMVAKNNLPLKVVAGLAAAYVGLQLFAAGLHYAQSLLFNRAAVGVAQAAKEAGNMVDLDSNPTKLIEVVHIGKQMLMTRGSLTTFSIANDVAKYFAIIPAAFAATYPQLNALNIMRLHSPDSAILSAVIFNALIIVFLIPLALKGVSYKPLTASAMLRRNLWIYGLGGLLVPFIGIKVIDLLLTVCGLV